MHMMLIKEKTIWKGVLNTVLGLNQTSRINSILQLQMLMMLIKGKTIWKVASNTVSG